ncbi:hypothetical protein ACL1BN_13690, partial [Corynebacterium striatum]
MTVLQGFMEKPETDKFSTYVRLSMHATLLAIAVLSFRQVSVSFDDFQPSLVLLVVLLNAGLTTLVVERTPAFSTAARPLGALYPSAIAVNLLCWAVSIGLLATQRAPHLTGTTSGLSEVPRVLFLGLCLVFHYFSTGVVFPKIGFYFSRRAVAQALVEP